MIAPFLDLMPLLPPSFVRMASRPSNSRQEQKSAAKKKIILPQNEWLNIPFLNTHLGYPFNDIVKIQLLPDLVVIMPLGKFH